MPQRGVVFSFSLALALSPQLFSLLALSPQLFSLLALSPQLFSLLALSRRSWSWARLFSLPVWLSVSLASAFLHLQQYH
jgi:hypothetical protein